MKILREVTQWDVPTPNHDYVINDGDKMVAYRTQDSEFWQVMHRPRMFSRSRRSFKKLNEPNTLQFFQSLEKN